MNINKDIRNRQEYKRNERGLPTKIAIFRLLSVLYYQAWCQINAYIYLLLLEL